MDKYKKYISEKIYQLRSERAISARELSLSLGYSPGYINKIENSRSIPSLQALFEICEYFKVSPRDFFEECELKVY